MARVGKPMQQANQMLKTLNPITDELSKRLNLGTELLKTDAFNQFKLPL
jgi:hypothetical protein